MCLTPEAALPLLYITLSCLGLDLDRVAKRLDLAGGVFHTTEHSPKQCV